MKFLKKVENIAKYGEYIEPKEVRWDNIKLMFQAVGEGDYKNFWIHTSSLVSNEQSKLLPAQESQKRVDLAIEISAVNYDEIYQYCLDNSNKIINCVAGNEALFLYDLQEKMRNKKYEEQQWREVLNLVSLDILKLSNRYLAEIKIVIEDNGPQINNLNQQFNNLSIQQPQQNNQNNTNYTPQPNPYGGITLNLPVSNIKYYDGLIGKIGDKYVDKKGHPLQQWNGQFDYLLKKHVENFMVPLETSEELKNNTKPTYTKDGITYALYPVVEVKEYFDNLEKNNTQQQYNINNLYNNTNNQTSINRGMYIYHDPSGIVYVGNQQQQQPNINNMPQQYQGQGGQNNKDNNPFRG